MVGPVLMRLIEWADSVPLLVFVVKMQMSKGGEIGFVVCYPGLQ